MDVATFTESIVVGLLAGSAGAVLVAGPVAWRGERARRRYADEVELFDLLRAFRDHLEWDHTRNPDVHYEGTESASPTGREQLARDVLSKLPYLASAIRESLRDKLIQLVGLETVDLMRRRLGTPMAGLDPDDEARRVGVLEFRNVRGDVDAGLLGNVANSPNRVREHYVDFARAVEALNAMIVVVDPTRKRGLRPRR